MLAYGNKCVMIFLILTSSVTANIGLFPRIHDILHRNFESRFYSTMKSLQAVMEGKKEVGPTQSEGYILLSQGVTLTLNGKNEDLLSDSEKLMKKTFGTEFKIPPLNIEVCDFGMAQDFKLNCFCCGEWEESQYGGKICQVSTFVMCPDKEVRRRKATNRPTF